MSCIGEVPVLVSDVVARMRHGESPSKRRWQNVRVENVVEQILRVRGVQLRFRTHGAGLAVYAALAPFDCVETNHGMKPVRPY